MIIIGLSLLLSASEPITNIKDANKKHFIEEIEQYNNEGT